MIETDKDILNTGYSLVSDFLNIFNQRDFEILKLKYGVSDLVAQEMVEAVEDFFEDKSKKISPPPLGIAFQNKNTVAPFEMLGGEDGCTCWRIDCQLWSEGEEVEPRMMFDLFKEGEKLRLQYLYTGS